MSQGQRPIVVVGIGADGWGGLSGAAQDALRQAEVVAGSERQLALLEPGVSARREPWGSPLLDALPAFLERNADTRVVVLASGDPMFFGIGATLARLVGPENLTVFPGISSISLACARLGWPVEDVDVVSLVGRPVQALNAAIQPGRRLLVLVSDRDGAGAVASRLSALGYGTSALAVLEDLSGPDEQLRRASAATWDGQANQLLAIVAVECAPDATAALLPRTPGLPDDAFEHDGQITKREVRAVTLAALGPVAGQLLWDVGAGSGSVAIEWMRVHPASRAIAIEPREARRLRITRNADALGVPGLQVIAEPAPAGLRGLPKPDAIFVGGGATTPGVVDTCLAALNSGGRLVVNAVTLESGAVVGELHARLGGTLTRIAVERAESVGSFTGWTPSRAVTQWAYRKDAT